MITCHTASRLQQKCATDKFNYIEEIKNEK